MLAYYICANLVLGSWSFIRWFIDGRRRLARVQSGRPFRIISSNPITTVRPRAIIGRADTSRWFETMHDRRTAARVQGHNAGGPFTDIEASVPPRSGSPAHLHKDHDKIFKVLEGTFRFQCAGDVFDVTPGTTIIVARGVEHSWMNLGLAPGRIVFSFSPGGSDGFFDQIGR